MGGYCHADEAKPDVKVPKEGHEVEAQRTKDPAAAARYGNSAAKVSDTIGGPLDLSRSIQPKP